MKGGLESLRHGGQIGIREEEDVKRSQTKGTHRSQQEKSPLEKGYVVSQKKW